MTDAQQLVWDLSKLREQIKERCTDADREATSLAMVDISSAEAVQANDKAMKWRDLKEKVDDLTNRVIDLLPKDPA